MRRIGVRKLLPLRKSSFGSNGAVGSGIRLNHTTTAERRTMGSAIILITRMWRCTKAPAPSSRDRANPKTKIACQVNGLKTIGPLPARSAQ